MTGYDPQRALQLWLALTPGLMEYEQGYAAGWDAGRADLMRQLAERLDCMDATWQTIERPTWEQRVAERIAEMERAGAEFRAKIKGSEAAA